jgi:hypothetical protein
MTLISVRNDSYLYFMQNLNSIAFLKSAVRTNHLHVASRMPSHSLYETFFDVVNDMSVAV